MMLYRHISTILDCVVSRPTIYSVEDITKTTRFFDLLKRTIPHDGSALLYSYENHAIFDIDGNRWVCHKSITDVGIGIFTSFKTILNDSLPFVITYNPKDRTFYVYLFPLHDSHRELIGDKAPLLIRPHTNEPYKHVIITKDIQDE